MTTENRRAVLPANATSIQPRIRGILILAGVWIAGMVVVAVFAAGTLASVVFGIAIIDGDVARASGAGILMVLLLLAAVIIGLLTLRDFFRKRVETRSKLYLFCAALMLSKSFDVLLGLSNDNWKFRPEKWTSIDLTPCIVFFVIPAVWILYFNFSKRVASTFTMQTADAWTA